MAGQKQTALRRGDDGVGENDAVLTGPAQVAWNGDAELGLDLESTTRGGYGG